MDRFKINEKIKLSKFLLKNGYGYSEIQKLLRKGDIKINGARQNSDCFLEANDILLCFGSRAEKQMYSEIYSDDNILIVNKNKNVDSDELFARLKGENQELYYIHRLDRNTDGIIVFAKNVSAETELNNGFKNRLFEKYYTAEVFGKFDKKEDTLTAYLDKDSSDSRVYVHSEKQQNDVKIITAYKVLSEKEETSIIEVKLITGKTHQIRAHLSFLGHFVIGDGKYGIESINKKYNRNRQCLTASRIVFHFEKGSALYYLDGKEFTV